MLIINAMFGKGLGGIEQAYLDYNRALALQDNQVIAVVHKDAAICDSVVADTIHKINNYGQWDFLAIYKLRLFIKQHQPDAIIVHGNRAAVMMRHAAKNIAPVIGVTHNYSLKHIAKLDAVFAITNDLRKHVIDAGIDKQRVYDIPNMLEQKEAIKSNVKGNNTNSIPTIGTMGRFITKKGFNIFIDAVKILTDKHGRDFKFIIGGGGKDENSLRKRVIDLGLDDIVQFIGWVEDKKEFFNKIDIFVLPSLDEPFGIVLLEAFNYHVPVISTDTQGPNEIISTGKTGILVAKNNPQKMADAIYKLIGDKDLRHSLSQQAAALLASKYDIKIVSQQINSAIIDCVNTHTNFISKQY